MNKGKIYVILAVVIVALIFFSIACTNTGYDYPKMIDDTRKYESIALTDEQKNIAKYCRIEGYYVSGEYKIVRIISEKGYVDEIELLVLIEGTILREIKGVEVKETQGYGAKCFDDKFLTQFYGRDLLTMEPLTGRQDNYEPGDILYVTGATKTSRALITGVNGVATFIKSL